MQGFFATDCDQFIPNRFATVHFAAVRARELYRGSPSRIERGADSAPLIALREIAAGAFTADEVVNYLTAPRHDEDVEPFSLPAPGDDVLRDGALRDAAALASRQEELDDPESG